MYSCEPIQTPVSHWEEVELQYMSLFCYTWETSIQCRDCNCPLGYWLFHSVLCTCVEIQKSPTNTLFLAFPSFPFFPLPCLPCPIVQNELYDMETWKTMKLLLSQTAVCYQHHTFLLGFFSIFMPFLFVFQYVVFPLWYQLSNNAKQKTGKCFSF